MAIIGRYTQEGSIIRSDGAHVPNDPRNKDYAFILEQIAKGDTIDPYVELVPIPQEPTEIELLREEVEKLKTDVAELKVKGIAK